MLFIIIASIIFIFLVSKLKIYLNEFINSRRNYTEKLGDLYLEKYQDHDKRQLKVVMRELNKKAKDAHSKNNKSEMIKLLKECAYVKHLHDLSYDTSKTDKVFDKWLNQKPVNAK
jgi:hypothetical protein